MRKTPRVLIKKFFEEHNLVNSDIESFSNFIDFELNKIIEENRLIQPTIIPHNIDDFKIRLDKIWVTKPEITEADGSKRPIYPIEARLRKISYSAPIYIEISSHINGIQRESFTTQIGSLPIMLKSKYCHLNKLSKEELVQKGEDPDDSGGYFIINGTERVLINVEDLSANTVLVEAQKTGPSAFIGKIFSEYGSFKIPHTIEKMKDNTFFLSFTRVKRVPIVIVVKALGLVKDEDIMRFACGEEHDDSLFVNLLEFVDIKTEQDALDWIAKKIGITQSKEIRIERMEEIMDKYLLPHLGIKKE